jgi:hypothetical protein
MHGLCRCSKRHRQLHELLHIRHVVLHNMLITCVALQFCAAAAGQPGAPQRPALLVVSPGLLLHPVPRQKQRAACVIREASLSRLSSAPIDSCQLALRMAGQTASIGISHSSL